MPELPVEARGQIAEMDPNTLVEFFGVCIEQDHLAIADYILNTLYATLDPATQQRIYTIVQAGADRALNEAVNRCVMQ
jgi:hypothetical protein